MYICFDFTVMVCGLGFPLCLCFSCNIFSNFCLCALLFLDQFIVLPWVQLSSHSPISCLPFFTHSFHVLDCLVSWILDLWPCSQTDTKLSLLCWIVISDVSASGPSISCAQSMTMTLFKKTLHDIINKRNTQSVPCNWPQMWKLIYGCITESDTGRVSDLGHCNWFLERKLWVEILFRVERVA